MKNQAKDVREMTVQELVDLADEVRSAPVGSARLRRAADRMAMAAWCLQGGALEQMVWWADDVVPEPPPDEREDVPEPQPAAKMATILEFPGRNLSTDGRADAQRI